MITVCVPLFGDLGHWRTLAWETCRAHWEQAGFGIETGTGESRAAARNDAAGRADGDVLVFADSDTLCPPEQVHAAVQMAADADSMVIAYRTLHRLQRGSPLNLERPGGYRVDGCSNGVLAVSRRLWEETGGFDERFQAWGGEDRAFYYACLTLRDVLRIPGHAVHLFHPPAPEAIRPSSVPYRANVSLALRYKAAAGVVSRDGVLGRLPDATRNPEVLQAILREPGGPLAASSLHA